MHQWITIFFVLVRISILRQDMAIIIMILWFLVNKKFIILFYDSLPKSKPFQSYLLNKGTCEKKVPSLLCIALHASSHVSFKMAAQKHAQFQSVVGWHSLVRPQTKHMVHLFFTALLRLSVACNDVSYCVSYRGTCIKICIISWEIVSLQC